MKYPLIAAGVALACVSGNAMALDVAGTNGATIKLVAAGASAARDSFLAVIAADLAAPGSLDVYRATISGSSPTSAEGVDFRAYSFTGKAGTPAGIAGVPITIYYRAEGGSAWGPISIVHGASVKRLEVDSSCSASSAATFTGVTGSLPRHNCPITNTYQLIPDEVGTGTPVSVTNLGTFAATPDANLVNATVDVGVSDEEPYMYRGIPGYPGSVKFPALTAATTATLTSLSNASAVLFGQAFGVILNSTGGVTSGITNLTRQDVASIFSGLYTDWSQVPNGSGGFYGAAPIKVVRREPGSGTQVAAANYFLGSNCSATAAAFVVDGVDSDNTVATSGNDTDGVLERGATVDVERTVSAVSNSIGLNVFKVEPVQDTAPAVPVNLNVKYVSINGVAGGKLNAAKGAYDFWYEATLSRKTSGLSTAQTTLANALVSNGSTSTKLPNVPSLFALPLAGVNTIDFASTVPTAAATRGKNSCNTPLGIALEE